MNKGAAFIIGVIFGSVSTLCLVKLRAYFRHKTVHDEPDDKGDDDMEEYKSILDEYVTYHGEHGETIEVYFGPHPIPPEEFGNDALCEDTVQITVYSDGTVIREDDGTQVDDPEDILGEDYMTTERYDENVLYIRDPRTSIDYEVYFMSGPYEDIT